MAGLVPFNKRNSHAVSTGFSDFDNMLDDFFTEGWPFGKSRMGGTFKIDIQENDKDYVVEAELPGAKKDDVSIDYDEGKLKSPSNTAMNPKKRRRITSIRKDTVLP